MSQNAVLDRGTVNTIPAEVNTAAVEAPVTDREARPVTRLQREHLTLVDWDRTTGAAPAGIVKAVALVIPARRPWFGWSEAGTALLLLSAGAACLSSLLHL